MLISRPVRLDANGKTYQIKLVVKTDRQEVAEYFREYHEAEALICYPSQPEVWYLCNEIRDAVYRDIETNLETNLGNDLEK